MDCALLLFQVKIEPCSLDPDRPSPKPSWGLSLKVKNSYLFLSCFILFIYLFPGKQYIQKNNTKHKTTVNKPADNQKEKIITIYEGEINLQRHIKVQEKIRHKKV